jgi:hypothetical protein
MIGSSVRAQLTLWYAAALGATMVLLGTGLYLFVRAELLGRVEAQTRRSVAQIDTVLRHDPSEIEEIEEYGSAGYYRIRRTSGPTDSLLYRSVAWRRDSLGRGPRGGLRHRDVAVGDARRAALPAPPGAPHGSERPT